mmetsp:Transcript_41220/g.57367  ORF Transcript_41220/g.57367 Transcript_41220/m.57367 type:complete len:202 (+) Transcript_41220:1564-2169(+)
MGMSGGFLPIMLWKYHLLKHLHQNHPLQLPLRYWTQLSHRLKKLRFQLVLSVQASAFHLEKIAALELQLQQKMIPKTKNLPLRSKLHPRLKFRLVVLVWVVLVLFVVEVELEVVGLAVVGLELELELELDRPHHNRPWQLQREGALVLEEVLFLLDQKIQLLMQGRRNQHLKTRLVKERVLEGDPLSQNLKGVEEMHFNNV